MVEWKIFEVKIKTTARVVGALPKDPNVIDTWVESRGKKHGRDPKEIAELKEKVKDETVPQTEEDIEKNWKGFKYDDTSIYLESRCVKANIREGLSTLDYMKGKGSMAVKQAFQHGLFVQPQRIRFYRNGKLITEPEGQQDRVLHVMTMRGMRDCLSREDYVEEGATVSFKVRIVVPSGGDRKSPYITETMLKEALEVGQWVGLGASRSQGFGTYKITSFKEVGN